MKKIITYLVLVSFFFVGCSPQIEIVDFISVKQYTYPVLKNKDHNPILRIAVEAMDSVSVLEEIKIDLGHDSKRNIKSFKLFYTGKDSLFKTDNFFGKSNLNMVDPTKKGRQQLAKGINYFWLSCTLSDSLNLTKELVVDLEYLYINGKYLSSEKRMEKPSLRYGVAVRQHGDDNVHTYRIPGLATSKKGTLLAVYDVRREYGRDLQGHMDIGLSRSFDKGDTWEPMQIVLDQKEWGGLPEKFNGVSDASVLVNKNNGDIFIAGLWMHGVINPIGIWQEGLTEDSKTWNHQWRNKGSQPGLGVKQTSQFLITKSSDDGKTWSAPMNLTKMCKDPSWWLWAPAPGHGITLGDGTLVFPTQGRDEEGIPFSNITYSKDNGVTWETSKPAKQNTTESMAVQLSDGSILLNMRDNRNRKEKGKNNGRAVAVTKDLGETWQVHKTSNNTLIEPVCMASIHKHLYTNKHGDASSVLLFSNPNSKYKRINQTIKMSFDDGLTWPEKYWILLDERRGAGYSCLTSIDEDIIGILYEGSQAQMTFQKIDISEYLVEEI